MDPDFDSWITREPDPEPGEIDPRALADAEHAADAAFDDAADFASLCELLLGERPAVGPVEAARRAYREQLRAWGFEPVEVSL